MEKNWRFNHLGVIVRDMDKFVEHYQSLGIGTFQPETMLKSSNFVDFKVNGKTPDTIVKLRTRYVQIGGLKLELTQPIEGESPHKEFLNSKGEGIDHIHFHVDDLDKETDKLAKKGIKVIFSGKRQTGGFAYFDTPRIGNAIIAMTQW